MRRSSPKSFLAVFALILLASGRASAQTTYTWTGSTDDKWNLNGNWFSGVKPLSSLTLTDILFDSNSTSNLTTTNDFGTFSIRKLTINNPTGPVSIAGSGTLSIGAGGIDMSSATQNLTITQDLSVAAAQSWSVGTGATLAINSTNLTHVTGATLNLNGAGSFTTTTLTNTNDILGPWVTFGTGATMQYATVSGAGPTFNITGFTGTTAATVGAMIDTTGVANYELTATTNATAVNNFSANTIRYSGTGVVITSIATGGMTLNGIMAVGASGTLTLQTNPVKVGSTNELVITGTQNVTISSVIQNNNNGATPGAVTYSGTGTLTLSNTANAFSGGVTLNSGTLTYGSINASATFFGTSAGTVTLAGGRLLSPNNNGTATVPNPFLYSGGNITLEKVVNGTNSGRLDTTGLLTINNSPTITVVLNAGNTTWNYTGGLTLGAGASPTFVNTGSTAQTTTWNVTGGINLSGGSGNAATITNNGTSAVTLAGAFAGSAASQTLTLAGSGPVTVGTVDTGANNPGLIVNGTGVYTFNSTTGTFTGGVTLQNGTANIAASSTGSTGPLGGGTLRLDGGTIRASNNNGTFTLTNPFVLTTNGGTISKNNGQPANPASLAFAGGGTLNAGTLNLANAVAGQTGAFNLNFTTTALTLDGNAILATPGGNVGNINVTISGGLNLTNDRTLTMAHPTKAYFVWCMARILSLKNSRSRKP